jgi:hypothetical protein
MLTTCVRTNRNRLGVQTTLHYWGAPQTRQKPRELPRRLSSLLDFLTTLTDQCLRKKILNFSFGMKVMMMSVLLLELSEISFEYNLLDNTRLKST